MYSNIEKYGYMANDRIKPDRILVRQAKSEAFSGEKRDKTGKISKEVCQLQALSPYFIDDGVMRIRGSVY